MSTCGPESGSAGSLGSSPSGFSARIRLCASAGASSASLISSSTSAAASEHAEQEFPPPPPPPPPPSERCSNSIQVVNVFHIRPPARQVHS